MPATSSWYASVVSAALAYHLGGFALLLIRLPGYGKWSVLAENLYIDSLQALAFVALGALCRTLTIAVLRSLGSASRVVVSDICVVLFAFVGVAAIAIPIDSSGAALFGVLVGLTWGLPAVVLLSVLSIIVERYPWLQVLLAVALFLDASLLLMGLAFQLAV